jgi:hypothetical protein
MKRLLTPQEVQTRILSTLRFSDFEKEIPCEIDIVDGEDLSKSAELYNNILYSVIPKNHNINLGIFPEDQGFSSRHIILWSSLRDIPQLFDTEFKVVSIKIPPEIKKQYLKPLRSGVYSLSSISNTAKIKVVRNVDIYES